jgi:thiamine transport system ATP-binding protein
MALAVEGVSLAVGGREIVDAVSVTAAAGETLAILGPSGCGKTTLLRIIAGLQAPDSGRVLFDGEDVTRVPTYRRRFGMMFQDFALFPHLTVEKNVAFGLRGTRFSKSERGARVTELLASVGLDGYESRTTEALSGGERQRVALARSLAPEPRLLMLDEPLGSLDRGLRERLVVELRGVLQRLAIPAIYVTHDQFEAFAVADRLAIMRDGRIVRVGMPEAIYAEPQTEFVARFLGFENVVGATVNADGLVSSPVGHWRVAGGRPGPAVLLLRPEGVELAEGDGEGVVTGVISARLFQGASQRVSIEVAGQRLHFDLPAEIDIAATGSRLALRVPRVQLLAPAE